MREKVSGRSPMWAAAAGPFDFGNVADIPQKTKIHALLMQQKKNIRLLISLILMLGVTALLFIFSNTKSGSSVDRDLFLIENLDKIDRVLLEIS